MSDKHGSYYDHPEGKDAFGKMCAMNKYAALTGLAWSTIEVLMVSKPKGYLQTIARYGYFTGPLMGMASAFTISTYASTNFRGKDDCLNYFIGGAAAGGVYGACKRNFVSGCMAALFLGTSAVIKKMSIQEGWEFFPEVVSSGHGSLTGCRHDYTLTAERPKNWTTGH